MVTLTSWSRLRWFLFSAVLFCEAGAGQSTPGVPQGSRTPVTSGEGIFQFEAGLPFAIEGGMEVTDPLPTEMLDEGQRGEFAIAPIPFLNPTIGYGLGGGAIYARRWNPEDAVSPPSTTMGGGFFTENGSWGVGAAQKWYLAQDRLRILVGGAKGKLNYSFYGVGADSGGDRPSIELTQEGGGFIVEGLIRFWGRFFVGPRYTWVAVSTGLNTDSPDLPIELPPTPQLDTNVAALGAHIQRDTRDNQFYPSSGSVMDLRMDFYGESVGSDFAYQKYGLSYNKYVELKDHHILAMRVSSCASRGDAPFFGLCTLGSSADLRGYDGGEFRNTTMMAGQAEYRLELPRRFGLVGFAGLGEVAPTIDSFNFDDLLPSAGVGFRYTLAPDTKINFRVDYARGRDSRALYVSFAEAF